MLPCARAVAAKKVDVKNVEPRILNVVLKSVNLGVSDRSEKSEIKSRAESKNRMSDQHNECQ